MSVYDAIFGNEALKNTLRGFASRRAFPNSFMISGAEGSGKTLAAVTAAMAIACESDGERPCGICSACKKIKDGTSPDVITITALKDRKTIGVEAVREIKKTAYILPNDLSVKVYIIKDAEKMTSQAQNALLKLFEEGPSSAYFIILTANPSALLPTVRSRAPEMKTEIFSDEKLGELIVKSCKKAAELKKTDPTAFKRLISAAGGSYGKAYSIAEGKGKKVIQTYKRAEELLFLLSEENTNEFLLAILSECNDRENYTTLLRLMQTGLRDMTVIKKGEGAADLLLFADEAYACELSEKFSLRALIRLSSELDKLASQASETNVNLKNAAITAYGSLKELK